MTFFQKTFGGLNLSYYVRHFLFGLIFFAIFFFGLVWNNPHSTVSGKVAITLVLLLLQLLYPYARFVYESVIDYIFGDNVFIVNAIFMLSVKFSTMAMCWIFSPFIAPLGMLYLYFYYTKQEKENSETK